MEYLKNVFQGTLIPLQTCPMCNGLGRASFEFRLEDINAAGLWVPSPESVVDGDLILDAKGVPILSSSNCPVCNGTGYFSDPSAQDMTDARDAALGGLLGADIRAIALGHERPARRPGGWAAKKGSN
jgi:hypothetical protein